MKRKFVNENENEKVYLKKKLSIIYPINKDCRLYRSRYPSLSDSTGKLSMNLKFYANELKSAPNPGGTIEEILTKWSGKYELLERHHGYIQWLFPLRVQGLNSRIHCLQTHEAKKIIGNRIMKMRVLNSYRLMLNFYGLRLSDQDTGKLTKEPNFENRFANMLRHSHNLMRITRIIRSLGELGWANLQRSLVEVFLDLLLDRSELRKVLQKSMNPGEINLSIEYLRSSCVDYWVNSVLDESDWKALQTRAISLVKTC